MPLWVLGYVNYFSDHKLSHLAHSSLLSLLGISATGTRRSSVTEEVFSTSFGLKILHVPWRGKVNEIYFQDTISCISESLLFIPQSAISHSQLHLSLPWGCEHWEGRNSVLFVFVFQ